jgi:histidinol-phosphate aminotransferase
LIEIIKSNEQARRTEKLARIKGRSVALDAALMTAVTEIIDDVRRRGDAALVAYTARFDGVQLAPAELRVNEHVLRASAARVDADVLAALRAAIKNIRAFHEHERRKDWQMETANGSLVGQRFTPIERAGLYVPGGTAAYPSSVVMNVVPAQVAGVERIVVVTPPRTLAATPAVAAALVELGVTEIYQVGGAQAVAALAYGTETIPRVDKITGPGNRYVAAAKKLVFGAVGIDSIAGPSEVVIVADETARAAYVAADLLAQAEHGTDASAVLITTSAQLAVDVAREIERQTEQLPRRAIIAASLADFGAIIIVADLAEACALVNELAPEHLELITQADDAVAAGVRHAGAIFFGAHTPEALGDYLAGPNHVLPTGGAARFSSALSVNDFLRHTTLLHYTRTDLAQAAPLVAALARAEGLDAHARSALIRQEESPKSEVQSPRPEVECETLAIGLETWDAVIKPRVRELKAYTLAPDRAPIKINQNENPFELPVRIKDEVARRLQARAWGRYPDFVPVALHEKLAKFADWTTAGVIAGNGSNELIQATLMTTVEPGKRVLISEPTFALYRQVTTVLGGETISVPLAPDLTFDISAILTAVAAHNPTVVILCSPNNPTGCRIAEADLRAVLTQTRGLVVIDEAYFEFAQASVVPLLNEYPHLVVFRTFSKAMALAGLRVGYLLAAPEVAREIGKAVLPYNLNFVSQTAAEVAVEMYDAELSPLVTRIIAERARVFTELQPIKGLAPVPSQANFMVVRSIIEPRRVCKELLARGILVRDVSRYPMLADYFRFNIGTPTENDALIAALQEIFAEAQL